MNTEKLLEGDLEVILPNFHFESENSRLGSLFEKMFELEHMSAANVREQASEIHLCIYSAPQIIYLTLYYALAYEFRALHYFRNLLKERKETKSILDGTSKSFEKLKKFQNFKLKSHNGEGLEWFQRNINLVDDHIELYESKSESDREEGWSEDSSD